MPNWAFTLTLPYNLYNHIGEPLSLAFDVIDHPILLKYLELSFGIKKRPYSKKSRTSSTELGVFQSRIKHHKMYVFVLVYHSDPFLSQTNYSVYTKSVSENIIWHNIKYHCYADVSQFYMGLKPCDIWDDSSYSIEAYLAHIKYLNEQQPTEVE